ncbi:YTH domain-containing protein 1-like [Vespa mandarinia]|uniref:YTH domain-containing protein 1-like n=1 Tax=Vespa mandarinia TaxID=7446 RepID=UPI00161881E5|nr:YTH domain-containing protein 1-like [Vespa mandarinia]XP_035718956.1 YTH domain-containing protein 1-like [Vespa mandarinia]XP_035718957.1 YTH domain-containing protein 1-like [Vespa mandarinia]XP_035718958.1 YTH domain-containing protein 1-like [Vespa mandarinia]XP_046818509.1 YTH domain-containing protein 1 [Vespa crabro]XP_046818510.1 YTH domain-containing protein 1 [Vespa crabro]XP_046818511.1 YTH domain-containing protein 1 [Vespa crabro]XP_046818512.1 YTH domain-containing protein 
MDSNADADNLNLSCGENDIVDELKIGADETYDTRSEVSSSSSNSDSSQPSISSISTKSSRGDNKRNRKNKGKRARSRESKSSSPETKRARSKESKGLAKSYDYATKLNYLFRDARFFIIKSNNAENVTLSKAKGVWSTLPQNEANLNQAYRESRNVLLIFSVKESGKFAGFARLSTESRRDGAPISWVLPPGLSAKALGGVFKVDWICRKELPFTATLHLYNPWNDGKQVKIGRDGQEIEPRVAEELCRLFPEDEGIEMTPILRKSKEAAKHIIKSTRSYRDSRPISNNSRFLRTRGRGRRLFLTSRSRLASLARGSHLSSGEHRGSRDHHHHHHHRYTNWFNRGDSPYSKGYGNTGLGVAAAAEAYVADYMRTMQHQLPPLPPYAAPHPYDPLPPPPPPPRYYDGLPLPPDYTAAASALEKRSYERSVDEFLWRTASRHNRHSDHRSSRDHHHRYRDRR